METKAKAIEVLKGFQVFFNVHNVKSWDRKAEAAIQQIQAGTDVKSVLSNFVGAGMGSLIDLYICADNGHILKASEEDVNKQLENLTTYILTIKNAFQ